jgi:hypothetical protein
LDACRLIAKLDRSLSAVEDPPSLGPAQLSSLSWLSDAWLSALLSSWRAGSQLCPCFPVDC